MTAHASAHTPPSSVGPKAHGTPHSTLEVLKAYLACPSVSADPAYAAGMQAARECVLQYLKDLGFSAQVMPTARHPIVLGRRPSTRPGAPSLLLYGHYDVQPPDPLDQWHTPPFEPHIRGQRLYARGSVDNKGAHLALLAGLAQALAQYPDYPFHLNVLIEGEEEIGSPSLAPFLEAHRDTLHCPVCILSDTGSVSEDQAVITTGLRGLLALELVAHGPQADLHSGLYGGMVRNPLQALVQLCASLHTPEGWVNVPGFYDGITPPSAWQQAQLAAFPADLEAQRLSLGVPAWITPGGIPPLEASRLMPTLEFNGICGGYQGPGSKTIIPAQASVKITCRLVPGQDPLRIQALLTHTLQQRCPSGIRLDVCVSAATAAYGVTPPLPGTPAEQHADKLIGQAFRSMQKAVTQHFGRPPLFLPEGGSIPIISQIRSILGADSLMLGLMLPQDAIHGPNESLHLGLWERGIATYAEFFSQLAQYPLRPTP